MKSDEIYFIYFSNNPHHRKGKYPLNFPSSYSVSQNLCWYAYFWQLRMQNMQQDNEKNISVRDGLIEVLETQIKKQEEIIETQEELGALWNTMMN